MASLRQLRRMCMTFRATSSFGHQSPQYLPPAVGYGTTPHHRCLATNIHINLLEARSTLLLFRSSGLSSVFTAVLAGIFGAGLVNASYVAAFEGEDDALFPSNSLPTYTYLEGLAKNERVKLEELLKSKGIRSHPKFSVAVKGQKVTLNFEIPPTCEVTRLLANLVSLLGLTAVDTCGSNMVLGAWESAAAWQLSLTNPKTQNAASRGGDHDDTLAGEADLCIFIFRSLISSSNAEVEFMKSGAFSHRELEAFISVLQLSREKSEPAERKLKRERGRLTSTERSISDLEALGVRVFGLDESQTRSSGDVISWENIAGYDQQKREIEDTVLLALQSPDIYNDIARGTRNKFESNRPRAVLFEGPPGTGKTSCARVIANKAGVPLVYVPLEVVMSKYYGESERLLGKVFTLANDLPDGAILFLDEVDSFATSRDTDMHEATRRILSVLLRQIDGFEQDQKVIVIAATNRKQDLDPALMSRFDSVITFGLPDEANREKIAGEYAKHLPPSQLAELARATQGMSGRDIRDVCQQAERRWASEIIRAGGGDVRGMCLQLPPLHHYLDCAQSRLNSAKNTQGPFM